MFYEAPSAMGEEDFLAFRDFVVRHCGLSFDPDSRYLLEKRVHERMQATQILRPAEYLSFLRWDPRRDEELKELVDLLTTNETYFFREAYQLRALQEEILPEIRGKRGLRGDRTVRIWSAGCSTGEEPYTVAMLAIESGLLPEWKVEIYGSDINHRVLGLARRGEYRRGAFRVTSPWYVHRYFEEADGKLRVKDEVKSLVHFLHLNLLDSKSITLLMSHVDVILCRNVIMYFHRDAKRKVAETFFEVIENGGYLLLGHSESLVNVTPRFRLRHLKNDMVYQKLARETAAEPTPAPGDPAGR